jgi:glycosyltransferase involved in cell wall biosynthesis
MEDLKYIRVAVISVNYPSEFKSKFVFVHTRVKEYIKAGLDVQVFTKKEWGLDIYTYEGVEVICGSSIQILKNINKYNPDIVIDHSPHLKYSSCYHALLCRKYPVISWFHGGAVMLYVEGENLLKSITRVLLNSVFLRFDTNYVAVSQWMKQIAVHNCRFNENTFRVIPNYVDENLFKYHNRDFSGKLKIISLRDLGPKYGIDIGIKALNNIKQDFVWDIYGIGYDKKYVEYLKGLIETDKICIHERRLPHNKIAELYSKYDLFLAPSRKEAQGVAMVEAMMTGMPVVTTAVGGIPEFVDSNCGFIVKPEVEEIRQAVLSLIHLNPERKKLMSSNAAIKGRETSSYGYTIKKELELIKEVVQQNKR